MKAATQARRAILGLAAVAASLLIGVSGAAGDDTRLFRIGTGGLGGLYFPAGQAIARTLSAAATSNDCVEDGACVPGILAVAQLSNGSVANVEAISIGLLEAGLSQADIAHWAYTATGPFAGRKPMTHLRAIANLYPETLHVIARRESGIRRIEDLRGRRVSLDEPGSGTLADARLVLQAHGITEQDIDPIYVSPAVSLEHVRAGTLDAVFLVVGLGADSVHMFADTTDAIMLPIEANAAETIINEEKYFVRATIPAGTYRSVGEVATLSIGAQLVTSTRMSADLIYAATRAIWHPRNLAILRKAHAQGSNVSLESALTGIAIPLHPGAVRFYRERGLIE